MHMPTAQLKIVLVIDDDVSMNGTMQRKFQKLGFTTEEAHDGKKGLDLMRRKRFDGILLDLQLPIEDETLDKDGFDILKEKNDTMNADTPVFVLSAMEQDKRELAEKLGAKVAYDKLTISSPMAIAEEIMADLVAI